VRHKQGIFTFHLRINQLAFYEHSLDLVLEAGRIQLMLGSSSEDIYLIGEFSITGTRKMLIEQRVFFCPVDVI
jgi:beta-glucosidase